MFGRNRNLVGLDLGDSTIKLVELKPLGKGRGFQLSKLGWDPLSAEAIVDGQIMDSQLVIETIQRLFQRCRIKNTQVATALSGHSVIVKRISLPLMSEAELAVTRLGSAKGGAPNSTSAAFGERQPRCLTSKATRRSPRRARISAMPTPTSPCSA